jgi:hypothetical protein
LGLNGLSIAAAKAWLGFELMKIARPSFATSAAPCGRITGDAGLLHPGASGCSRHTSHRGLHMRAPENLCEKHIKMHFICG